MEVKLNIPFRKLLDLVRGLDPAQNAMLKAELDSAPAPPDPTGSDFLKVIAGGPVYEPDDIEVILSNRTSGGHNLIC